MGSTASCLRSSSSPASSSTSLAPGIRKKMTSRDSARRRSDRDTSHTQGSLPPGRRTEDRSSVKPPKRGSTSSTVVDVSSTVLKTLHTVSQFAPVPYLQEAASVALDFLNMVQQTKGNTEAYRGIAEHACNLVYSVVDIWNTEEKEGGSISEQFQTHMRLFVQTLNSVKDKAEKQMRRHPVKRFLSNTSDADFAQILRLDLQHAVHRLELQSTTKMRADIEHMRKTQAESNRSLPNSTSANGTESSSPPPRPSAFGNINASGPVNVSYINGDSITTSNNVHHGASNCNNVITYNNSNIGNTYNSPSASFYGGHPSPSYPAFTPQAHVPYSHIDHPAFGSHSPFNHYAPPSHPHASYYDP
ncbi:hypothetical protein HGRIS_003463 [Hohenbuehelia grisea]|uniref:Uncharacterized protein n=1 Tax=Hohenbuehelia grisea TaxID=104357 RepID=A0ABR3JGH1_9AGAR